RGRDYRGRARHRADAGAPREPFEHAGERRRSGPGGDARRPRRRRDLRLASQSLAGQPVAARRYRRPVGRGGAARGLPGLADRPSARHPGARRVVRRELRARGRGQCLVRAGKPGRRLEGWRLTHRPGQLVGYPILDLRGYRHDLHWYLRTLEDALIAALAELGVPAERNAGYTGVWTRGGRKIASIGIHVKQWVTWHGFALNVTTDLGEFERIVPCGIEGVEMTSIEREATAPVAEDLWAHALDAVVRGFEDAFGVKAEMQNDVPQLRHATASS